MLGLGSQIKPHITKRYSMPWSHPAPRMRELILAIRAIWESWATGERLAFRGEFYTHTLMTPFFDPGPNPFGNPKILLAAVGDLMAEVAGEVADGLLVHGFTTERYLREVSLPALERGAAKAGKTREDLTVCYPGFVVTGATEEDVAAAARAVKAQIAFYGSTPAYRPVLDLHGWGDLHPELNALSKRGEWVAMGELIDDEILEAFAVVCPLDEVPARVLARFGGVVDRFSFYTPYELGPEQVRRDPGRVPRRLTVTTGPDRSGAGRGRYTTTLTSRGGRTTTRRAGRPSSACCTRGEARASDRASSSPMEGSTSRRSRTLPLTWTTSVTRSSATSSGSKAGQDWA